MKLYCLNMPCHVEAENPEDAVVVAFNMMHESMCTEGHTISVEVSPDGVRHEEMQADYMLPKYPSIKNYVVVREMRILH
jgi:hypothetical protein